MKFWILIFFSISLSFGVDTLFVRIQEDFNSFFTSPVGVWWPEKLNSKDLERTPIVVWFHGGMTSSNCEKGLMAGNNIAELYPQIIVLSASACKENHWVKQSLISVVDYALDSLEKRLNYQIQEINLVGVSDGALGVFSYSLFGKRNVQDRLLVSSYGLFVGDAFQVASQKKIQNGNWIFFQGGLDRLYNAKETIPWIKDFCLNLNQKNVDCKCWYDPKGEHDWSYWINEHKDWIYKEFLKNFP